MRFEARPRSSRRVDKKLSSYSRVIARDFECISRLPAPVPPGILQWSHVTLRSASFNHGILCACENPFLFYSY